LEVCRRVLIQRGIEDAMQAAALMQVGRVVDLDTGLALLAAQIGVALKLALADSVVLATARAHNAVLWTQDQHFDGLDGVRYMAKK
jgi:predicted nucleic acid-binding protein